MTFLSPMTGLLFAGIAIPLLLLLYFLKLRRQERRVSSTFLWKKAVQDLQVNAPFQKLRRNLLLFLQLLLLAAVLLGLAEPVANFSRTPEKRIVVMIDRSASMKTREADGRSRLEHAQDAAVDFVRDLPDHSSAMVLSFGSVPTVVCTFTDDKRRLERLIRGIEPTDEPSLIGEALPLAIAYSTNLVDIPGVGGSSGAGSSVPEAAMQGAADIEFFSDGRIADADQQYVTRGNLRYYRVGATADNVGITAFDVRRDFERPGIISVFVQVENFGAQPVKTDVGISLDGKPLPGPGSIREVQLGPAARDKGASPGGPEVEEPAGTVAEALPPAQNVIFEFAHEAGGMIQVEVHRDDAMKVDNFAQAPIDPPRQVRILGVSDRASMRVFIEKAMRAFEIQDYRLMGTEEYDNAPDGDIAQGGRSAYDLVILDGHDTDRLAPGNYLFFGGVPKVEGVSLGDLVEGEPIIFGREDHPLMRNVAYEGIFISKWRKLELPEHAVSLLEGSDSVLMAALTDPGHRYVIGSFDLLESNWPIKEAFPIFLQNAIGYLASGGLIETKRVIRPGDTISATVPAGATTATITRPDGGIDERPARPGTILSYARTKDAGVYRVAFDDPAQTSETYAANLLDANESRIAPNERFTVGSENVEAVRAETRVNEPLWPWAAGMALVLLIVEWWIYNRRVMI